MCTINIFNLFTVHICMIWFITISFTPDFFFIESNLIDFYEVSFLLRAWRSTFSQFTDLIFYNKNKFKLIVIQHCFCIGLDFFLSTPNNFDLWSSNMKWLSLTSGEVINELFNIWWSVDEEGEYRLNSLQSYEWKEYYRLLEEKNKDIDIFKKEYYKMNIKV